VTVNTTMFTATNFTMVLTETTTNSQWFSNFGLRQPANITPQTPDVSGQGVFYVRTYGFATDTNVINITLTTATQQVTVAATRLSNTTTYVTGKLLVVPSGVSVTYTNITVIQDDPTSIVASRVDIPLSQTSNTLVRSAFVGRGNDTSGWLVWVPPQHASTANDINNVAQILSTNLNYTIWGGTPNYSVDLAHLTGALPSNSVFYIFAHGVAQKRGEPFQGFNVWRSDSLANLWASTNVTPSMVSAAIGSNSYTLVFINGCLSADGSATSSNMAAAFNAKAYVGWSDEVLPSDALDAAVKFFNALATTNVAGAVAAAQPNPDMEGKAQLTIIGDGTVRIDLTNPHN
jgi:hypothetical protein